jgi:hypothetical protein
VLDDRFDQGAYTVDGIVELFGREFGFRGGREELEDAWASGFVLDHAALATIDMLRSGVGGPVFVTVAGWLRTSSASGWASRTGRACSGWCAARWRTPGTWAPSTA